MAQELAQDTVDTVKGQMLDPPVQEPDKEPTILSRIHPVWLEENIDGAQGRFASISVLEPVMRIERTGPLDAGSNTAALYRIILNFTIQFTIKGFDRDQE